mgnify:FL=1|jgi:hypothetical protein
MGLLDQSTNNVILDAVLTDVGRELLARNDGSFNIVKFAFSDDEVDYTIIQKYGRTVGKEKIIKNTPVLEALTNGDISQMHKLLSLSTPTLIRLPSFALESLTSDTFSLNIISSRSQTITLKQTVGGDELIPAELKDQNFRVEVNNLFLQLGSSARPVSIDTNNIATYILPRDSAIDETTGGTKLTFTVNVKSSLTTTLFNTYGVAGDKTKVRSYIQVTGQQSGAQKNLLAEINKSA